MAISYLGYKSWEKRTREERFFCAIAYNYARYSPSTFAKLVCEKSGIERLPETYWDIGFEVCFYRDFLWYYGFKTSSLQLSPKRTFDLCLFSENTIIIIEAKVFGLFTQKNADNVKKDKVNMKMAINTVLNTEKKLSIYSVALASSVYFENYSLYGKSAILEPFDGRLSWNDLYDQYNDTLFSRADSLYKSKPAGIVESEF